MLGKDLIALGMIPCQGFKARARSTRRWRKRQRYECRGSTCIGFASKVSKAPEDGKPASSRTPLPTPCEMRAVNYTHPPPCVGHPLPAFVQHQPFLAIDQPATQLANPALQSNGAELVWTVMHPPPPLGQPLPWTLQHHAFLVTDQPACQFENPAKQSNGSAGAGGTVGFPSQM